MSNFKQPKIREPKFLKSMQLETCEANSLDGCFGDIVGAHLDGAGGKGIATKTSDCFAGPLCFAHHTKEGTGAKRFWHTVFAEDTWFLTECLKAYRLIRFLRWLVKNGREKEAIEIISR